METIAHERNYPIAICGIGCRFPGNAESPQLFWKMLKNKTDAIGSVPKDRWDADALFDPNYRTCGKIHVKEGGFIDRIDEFDASFFGIAPVEAHCMDPAHRLLLEHTYAAFEDAGEQIDSLEGKRVGVFVGTSSSEYAGIMQNYSERANIGAHTNTGSSPAISANRISYVFDLRGPSFAVDTACSSSLVAAHLACRSIWNAESSSAIVAGVALMLKPELHMGFSTAGFLSPDARSKSFDAQANGYVRSEGVGVLYLKPLDQAMADGNQIYATIIGSAINEDGRTNGIALPNPEAQVDVITRAYDDAGISPSLVTLVEAHGTGTAAGDPIECKSIGSVIGKNREDNCLLGSVKSNIGHTELASGAAGLIKLALSLYYGQAPPTVHFETPNPAFDFKGHHMQVVDKLMRVPKRGDTIYAGINSFGFGGANVHLVLKSHNKKQTTVQTDETFPLPLTISARSDAALKELAAQYSQLLQRDDVELNEVARQAALHRSHLEIRSAVAATDKSDAVMKLKELATGKPHPHVVTERPRKRRNDRVAFVFSGQGPQWFAMGRELLNSDKTFRETVEEVNAHLLALGWLKNDNSSLLEELLKSESDSRINQTHIVQPALFALQVGLARIWKRLGIVPDMVVGHSIGEVAAAYVSGALTMDDAVKLVYWRSRCQSAASGRGRMMAASLTQDEAKSLLPQFDGKIDIAAVNGPTMLTLAGDSEALQILSQMLKEDKIFNRFLVVDVPFHSYLLDDVAKDFSARAPIFEGDITRVPLYSTVTSGQIDGGEINREYWARNIRETVLFYPTLKKMVADGATVFVEVSPHPILSHGVKEALDAASVDGIIVPSLRKKDNEKLTLTRSLAVLHARGLALNWKEIFANVAEQTMSLPRYPWQREKYWMESNAAKEDRLAHRVHHHLKRKTVAADNPNDIIWEVELDARSAPYILDHRVQGPVVYPGAGHVDLAIAAGRASFGSKFGFVEDMEFLSPLFLKDSGIPYAVQIHIDTDDGRFTIASKDAQTSDGAWTIHSRGKLNHIGDHFESPPVTLAVLKSRIDEPVETAPLFDMLKSGGLHLGDTFRGIEQLTRRENEALGKIKIHPSIHPLMSQFNLHPALLDASFQSAFGIIEDRTNMGVYIPRKIGRVKFYGPPTGDHIYSYARASRNEADTILVDIWILNENGSLIAEVEDFLGKYLKGSRGEVEGELDKLFYQSTLKHTYRDAQLIQRNPCAYLGSFSQVQTSLTDTVASLTKEPMFQPFLTELSPAMDELAVAYVFGAFEQLGAPLLPGKSYNASLLEQELCIVNKQKRLFRLIVNQLQQRKIITLEDGEYVVKNGFAIPDIRTVLERTTGDLQPFSPEIRFFQEAGAALADVLTGSRDPSEVLFADSRWDEIIEYYTSAYSMNKYNRMMQSALLALVAKSEEKHLRILEIGGGTGGITQAIIPLLVNKDVDYVFTDISPVFLERAQARFSAYPNISYELLNIEEDPEAQGRLLKSYDIVIASNVLHATKNIRDTLAHTRSLLADGGVLCMLEVTSVPFYVDLSFGMTDGWWRFDDNVRTAHCTLDGPSWVSLLNDSGFEDAFEARDVADGDWPRQSVLFGRANVSQICSKPKQDTVKWIVFGDAEGVSSRLVDTLRQRGDVCIEMTRGDSTAKLNEHLYQYHPSTLASAKVLSSDMDSSSVHILVSSALEVPVINPESPCMDIAALTDVLNDLAAISRLVIESSATKVSIFVVTNGVHNPSPNITQSPLWGLGRVMGNELSDTRLKMIDIAHCDEPHISQLFDELVDTKDLEEEVVLRNSRRLAVRMEPVSSDERIRTASVTKDIRCQTVQLAASETGILSQCAFVPMEPVPVQKDEVSISVHFAGLNFRDVMVAGGALDEDAIYGGLFNNGLGLECSGVVMEVGNNVSHVKKGDSVIAIAANTIAGKIVAKSAYVRKLPKDRSMLEGAGTPMAAITAYTALFKMGEIRPGSRVLIHSAAGGVGLFALHFAKAAGATVFATASPGKHDLLRKMGIDHIYSSRNTHYYSSIMADTDDQGVNIVLNSLSGPHVTQSLKLLAPMGRFIEIGKKDLYENRKIGLKLLSDNISWFALDIDRLLLQAPEMMSSLFSDALSHLQQHGWPNLPIESFAFNAVAAALTKMASGEHRGKIVLEAGPVPIRPSGKLTLRDDAMYLIAGGTRGLGLATAEFLAKKGAKHVALASRSGLRGEAEIGKVKELQKNGVQVETFAVDICDEAAVQKMIDKVHRIGRPLAGIIQSTLVLEDALLHKITPAQMKAPLQPKMIGTWNLHNATREISLDYFISFSSVSSLYGLPGQSNYAAANRFLDDFSKYRGSLGLPASTVNLGPLADTGFVAREDKVHDYLELSGWQPLSTREVLSALERIMLEGHPHLGVYRLNWNALESAFPKFAVSRRFDAVRAQLAQHNTGGESGDIKQLLSGSKGDRRTTMIKKMLAEIMEKILGIDSAKIDFELPINRMGMDSLMSNQLRSVLTQQTGIEFSLMQIMQGPRLCELAADIDSALHQKNPTVSPPKAAASNVRWAKPILRKRRAKLRLFTLPYLGAGASIFSSWRMSPEIEVCPIQLPGREERAQEAPITVGNELIAQMAKGIEPLLDMPFALYGHSFGGNLAMSLSSYLEGKMKKTAAHVFIAAAVPPGVENPLEEEFKVTDAQDALSLPAKQMKALLKRIGTPDSLLENDDRFLSMLPALRADLAITRQRTFPKDHVLQSPITAIAGDNDLIYSISHVAQWKRFTNTFRMNTVQGGHLFLHEPDAKEQLHRIITKTLDLSSPQSSAVTQKSA